MKTPRTLADATIELDKAYDNYALYYKLIYDPSPAQRVESQRLDLNGLLGRAREEVYLALRFYELALYAEVHKASLPEPS